MDGRRMDREAAHEEKGSEMYSECFNCKMEVLIENHHHHKLSRGQRVRERDTHTEDIAAKRWQGSVEG